MARLIGKSNGGRIPQLQTLQHRRDVVGLTVIFKVQVKRVSHLQVLWQPPCQAQVNTRVVAQMPGELLCWSWHHQHQYKNKYTSLWNTLLTTQTNFEFEIVSVQRFKEFANIEKKRKIKLMGGIKNNQI